MPQDTNVLPCRHRITVAEYHRMAEAGIFTEDERVELIDGELIDMTPIGNRHTTVIRKLIYLLSGATRGQALLDVQNPIFLGEHSEPQPDVVLLRPREDFYAASPPCAQDVLLLIEVADTSSSYDRSVKVPLYARFGIPEVWLVDLPGRVIEVFQEPSPEGYRQVRKYYPGEELKPGLLPVVSLRVDELLT